MMRSGSPLDSRQLECFIAVAEEANLTKAAARLHIAQPPLTRRIRSLEEEVGAELFHRSAGGVELTEAGTALLSRAYRIVALSTYAVEQARSASAGELGELVCGYSDPSILDSIPRLLADFANAHPGIFIRLQHLTREDQIFLVRDGILDVAFGRYYGEESDMRCRHIASEEIFLAVNERHPLSHRESVSLTDLRGLPLALFPPRQPGFAGRVLGMCMNAGFTAVVGVEADDLVSAVTHVAIGKMVSVVPRSAARLSPPGVRYVPVIDAPPEELACIHMRHLGSPALQVFLRWLDERADAESNVPGDNGYDATAATAIRGIRSPRSATK
jgi:DNA-binding transcriptional LysR family regulator